MSESYIRVMRSYERMSLQYEKEAEELYIKNKNKHTRDECVLYQKAARCRAEMVQMSNNGEEKFKQEQELRRLNGLVHSIVEELNGSREKIAAGSSTSRTSDDGIDTSRWYKEMPKAGLGDVAGMQKLKNQLMDCVVDGELTELYDYLGIRKQNAYLLAGPPGCGKTFLTEAFVHEMMEKKNYKYISLDGSDILSKYVGEAEKIVKKLFSVIQEEKQCIVFIDEIDGVCRDRNSAQAEHVASLTNAFLTGFNNLYSSEADVIFIGATNYPERIDVALQDRVELIVVELPDREARAAAFARKISGKMQLDESITYEKMGELTEKYNYRDIERLIDRLKRIMLKAANRYCGSASEAVRALKSGEFRITKELFLRAQAECVLKPKEKYLDNFNKWLKEFQEGAEE